jgi:SAM-dependent methyltransferase
MAMQPTPAHEQANDDLLSILPRMARRVIEIGCSAGALAREYKKLNPATDYVGVEITPQFESLAARYCDRVEIVDLERLSDAEFDARYRADCWVFGDTLEHMVDPWLILRRIRRGLPADGCVALCVPNARHWSVQVRLATGEFRYEDTGLLDRTHLRFFTWTTLGELVRDSGFHVEEAFGRVFDEVPPSYAPHLRGLAAAAGGDPGVALAEAAVLQYVLRIVPA